MKKTCLLLLLLPLLFSLFALSASADTGPKPSVTLRFSGFGEERAYVALFGRGEGSGPWRVPSAGDEGYREADTLPGGRKVYEAFLAYDAGGEFRYWGNHGTVSTDAPYVWGYYPPSAFRAVFYFPATGTYLESEVMERYAFDSYFAVTLSADGTSVSVARDRAGSLGREAVGFVLRLALTLAVEMGLAWCFGFRSRPALLFVFAVNALTQVGLNVILQLMDARRGPLAAVLIWCLCEVAVFVAEALVYALWFRARERGGVSPLRSVGYALIANAASMGVGLLLARVWPGIF